MSVKDAELREKVHEYLKVVSLQNWALLDVFQVVMWRV